MKLLNTDTLKEYKNKLSENISKIYADESDIENLVEVMHKYKIKIYPKAFDEYGTNAMCRLNIHRKTGKAIITALQSSSNIDTTAVFDNKYNLHLYTPTSIYNGTITPDGKKYPSGSFDQGVYCVENILEGNGQCLGGYNSPNKYYMELDISSLDRIEFFPSYNAFGVLSDYYYFRYSKAVTVKVECDGTEVFSDTISGLVKYDRVKIVFDAFNKVHLEKFNVGKASAFEQYY